MPANLKKIFNWKDIVKIHLETQALANLLFGLTLALIYLFTAEFSEELIMKLAFVYLGIYTLIYIPICASLPLVFFRFPGRIIGKIEKGEPVEEKEAFLAIKTLIDLPLIIGRLMFFIAFSGFSLGALFLSSGLIPELIAIKNIVVFTVLSIGFVVGIIHGVLSYVLLESYLRPTITFLISLYPKATQANLKVRRLSVFYKIFLLTLLTTVVIQLSLGGLYLSKIAFNHPAEFFPSLLGVIVVVFLGLSYILVIISTFAANLTYPLREIILWARGITKGGVNKEINLVTNDEVSDVIDYSKEMVAELEESKSTLEIRVRARTKELKELNETLEKKVEERTKELKERVVELEDFRRLTVGREIKMIELKEEIKRLKGLTGDVR